MKEEAFETRTIETSFKEEIGLTGYFEQIYLNYLGNLELIFGLILDVGYYWNYHVITIFDNFQIWNICFELSLFFFYKSLP